MKNYFLFMAFLFLRLNTAMSFELNSGDVLLISFNCFECRVIESETNSTFSHSGIVVKNELNEIRIAQSLGKVELYSLEQFLKNITPGTNVSVYRPLSFFNLTSAEYKRLNRKMLSIFNSKFKGAPFDVRFLWDNFDKNGIELLYCSEFIAKFVDNFLDTPTLPYPLSYKKNNDYWLKYFNGEIPEGVLGNSPASFSSDKRFVSLGDLIF